GWLRAEVVIVLALSLGQSAVYSLLSLAQALATGPLSEQTAALNRSLRPDPWLDLLYQLLSITFALVPVVLVVALLTLTAGTVGRALRDLGMDLGRPLKDVGWGLALTMGIGLPGLAVYYLGRVLGATVEVVPATLDQHWWAGPGRPEGCCAARGCCAGRTPPIGASVRAWLIWGWGWCSASGTGAPAGPCRWWSPTPWSMCSPSSAMPCGRI